MARIFEQDKVIAAVRKEIKESRENVEKARGDVAKAREQVAMTAEVMEGYKTALDMAHTKILELRKYVSYWRNTWLLTTIAAVLTIIVMCSS